MRLMYSALFQISLQLLQNLINLKDGFLNIAFQNHEIEDAYTFQLYNNLLIVSYCLSNTIYQKLLVFMSFAVLQQLIHLLLIYRLKDGAVDDGI